MDYLAQHYQAYDPAPRDHVAGIEWIKVQRTYVCREVSFYGGASTDFAGIQEIGVVKRTMGQAHQWGEDDYSYDIDWVVQVDCTIDGVEYQRGDVITWQK